MQTKEQKDPPRQPTNHRSEKEPAVATATATQDKRRGRENPSPFRSKREGAIPHNGLAGKDPTIAGTPTNFIHRRSRTDRPQLLEPTTAAGHRRRGEPKLRYSTIYPIYIRTAIPWSIPLSDARSAVGEEEDHWNRRRKKRSPRNRPFRLLLIIARGKRRDNSPELNV